MGNEWAKAQGHGKGQCKGAKASAVSAARQERAWGGGALPQCRACVAAVRRPPRRGPPAAGKMRAVVCRPHSALQRAQCKGRVVRPCVRLRFRRAGAAYACTAVVVKWAVAAGRAAARCRAGRAGNVVVAPSSCAASALASRRPWGRAANANVAKPQCGKACVGAVGRKGGRVKAAVKVG